MRAPRQRWLRRGLDLLLRPDRVEAALWRNHAGQSTQESRQRLFEHYRPFARRLSGVQFSRRRALNFERADVEQLAYEALIHAIDRFDPRRGAPFEAYARIRINGHISNGLTRTSEAAAEYTYRRRAEMDRLKSLRPGDADVALDPISALSNLSASIALGLILESELPAGIEAIPDPAPSAYESLAWNELHGKVHELIDRLGEREAYVIRQHYRNGVSFQQIAALLGVSKGRVSQIHKAALQRLRGQLARLR